MLVVHSTRFYFHFHLFQDNIFISFLTSFLIHWLFRSILFNFHIFVDLHTLLVLLISSFMPLWPEKIVGMISVFLNLCLIIWYVLDNVPYALEKNADFATIGLNILSVCCPFVLKYGSILMFTCWLFVWTIYLLLIVEN